MNKILIDIEIHTKKNEFIKEKKEKKKKKNLQTTQITKKNIRKKKIEHNIKHTIKL